MNIEITNQTIAVIAVSVVAIVGWVIAYYEYSQHSKAKSKMSSDLQAALDVKELDLIESEKLIKERITEIQSVYQSAIDDQNINLELYESYIKNFDAAITLCDSRLKELDTKGVFSTDDEIGFFFQNVKYLQEGLNKFKIDKEVIDGN